MSFPAPLFDHLRDLTDGGGLYEHALGRVIRPEHGYCLDDAARGLVVVSRAGGQEADLGRQYLAFVVSAQVPDGRFHNRLSRDRQWVDQPSVEDCWGRALWGLGSAVSGSVEADTALVAFNRSVGRRSPWSRAMAFAGLGAAEVLEVQPRHTGARDLLAAAAAQAGADRPEETWPWPEARLSYANAVLPEVLLAAGSALGRPPLVRTGLRLLGWLLDLQTRAGHLSVVPVGGHGPGDRIGGFDQQPIEVAALADACARAFSITGEARWRDGVELAASWFLGRNDSATCLLDAATGGGCDGLERDGRNDNQGAESTLALLATLQQVASVGLTRVGR